MKTIIALFLLTLALAVNAQDNDWRDIARRLSIRQAMPPLPSLAVANLPPPAPPLPAGKNVVLAFDAPVDPTVTGFRIYYRDEAGVTNSADVGMGTTNTLYLTQGASLKLWAVSYNSAGLESVHSNEISYTVPITAPPVRTAVIVLLAGPPGGPWTVPMATNRIPTTNTGATYRQMISYE